MAARLRRLLCICAGLVAMFVTLDPVRPAWAHASLLFARPADGVTIVEPPTSFVLDFNEPVSPLVMRLVRPDGGLVPLTNAVATNNSVKVAAPPMLQQGSYLLSWRVISADGHPVGGVVSFALGHPSSGVGVPSAPGATAVHAAIWIAQFILAIGLFIGAGGAAFAAWLAPGRPMPGHKVLAGTMVAAIAAALVSLPLQGLDALAQPLSEAWRPAIWSAGFGTSWGLTVFLAVATLAAGLLTLVLGNRFLARAIGLLAVAGIGFAYIASGHASTADKIITVPSVFLHATCVALWIGSLLPLALIVHRGDRAALEQFSRVIPVPLLVLIATGIVLAVVGFDRIDAFWTTDYGLVLAAKLVVVFAMLALAALNRYRLVPRLAAAGERRLVTVIATEFILAIVVLGLVGFWRFTPPPRSLAAAETTYIHFHTDQAMAQIDLTPERDRGATISIVITDDDDRPIAAKEVELVIWNLAAGIEPIRRTATFEGGGDWRVVGLRVPIGGVWRMRVEVLVNDFRKLMLEDNVELPRAP